MSESRKNFYEILEVDQTANMEAIKIAYKKLALKYHPDKADKNNPSIEQATELFKQLQNAYETLSDPITRKLYDDCQFGKTSIINNVNIFFPGKWTKKIIQTINPTYYTHKILYENSNLNRKIKYLEIYLCTNNSVYISSSGPEELYHLCLNNGFAEPHKYKCTVKVSYSKDIKEIIRFLSILNSFESIAAIFEEIINDISKTLGSNSLEYPKQDEISVSQLEGSFVSELKKISASQLKINPSDERTIYNSLEQ